MHVNGVQRCAGHALRLALSGEKRDVCGGRHRCGFDKGGRFRNAMPEVVTQAFPIGRGHRVPGSDTTRKIVDRDRSKEPTCRGAGWFMSKRATQRRLRLASPTIRMWRAAASSAWRRMATASALLMPMTSEPVGMASARIADMAIRSPVKPPGPSPTPKRSISSKVTAFSRKSVWSAANMR